MAGKALKHWPKKADQAPDWPTRLRSIMLRALVGTAGKKLGRKGSGAKTLHASVRTAGKKLCLNGLWGKTPRTGQKS